MNPIQQEIIRRGISTIKNVPDPLERAELLQAAAELLAEVNEDLAIKCRATATCLREAESCQLHLFNSLT